MEVRALCRNAFGMLENKRNRVSAYFALVQGPFTLATEEVFSEFPPGKVLNNHRFNLSWSS